MTPTLQSRAAKVLESVVRKAEEGSVEHEELVLRTVLAPFLKAEAGRAQGGGSKDRRPIVQINVTKTEGRAMKEITGRVLNPDE